MDQSLVDEESSVRRTVMSLSSATKSMFLTQVPSEAGCALTPAGRTPTEPVQSQLH